MRRCAVTISDNRDRRVVKESLARDMIEVHGTEAAATIARNS